MRASLVMVLVVVFSGLGAAAFPGMTPSSIDIDSVEPGEEVEQRIWFEEEVPENQTLSIDVSVSEISAGTLFSDSYSNHEEISEQRISDWWSFEIEPLRAENEFSPEGSDEVYQGYVDLRLDVPSDAEPGLRHGVIDMDPVVETDDEADPGGQVGFAFSPNLPYTVYVEGTPQRDITVQDVRGFRTDEDQASVEVLLTNTGTVTASTDSFEIDVLDGRGAVVDTLSVSGTSLEPGDSEWVNAFMSDGVEEGDFQVDGEVDYFTGRAYASGSFSLGDIIEVEEAPDDSPVTGDEPEETVPLWLVVMILALMAVLMWAFDIEPFWILVITGFIGLSALILMSGISNWLLILLVMTVGVAVYTVI